MTNRMTMQSRSIPGEAMLDNRCMGTGSLVRLHDVKQHWQQSTPKIKKQVLPGIPTQVHPRLPGLTLYQCDYLVSCPKG